MNTSRQKFCSIECRKVGVEKSQEKMYFQGLQNKFDHDYNYIFQSIPKLDLFTPKGKRKSEEEENKIAVKYFVTSLVLYLLFVLNNV